tara:strand:+ start:1245 stop:1895 length:651 start_codon:yes stop_codon:yes gene_type:complete
MISEFTKRFVSSIFLLPIVLFFIIKGSYLFNLFICICFLIIAYEWRMMTKKRKYNIYGYIFLILSFYSIYKLRNDFIGDYFYILLITFICIFTDLGGYFFGKFFKGPKLTKISPNKTYAGMIGGYFLSAVFIVFFLKYNFMLDINIKFNFSIILFTIIVSTISQLGDILISYFKRLSKIKDTGKVIPGHGGLLDRADGMIFAFPFSYILLSTNLIN